MLYVTFSSQMVPDLMSIQDYGKIPIASVDTGSAQNSQ